MTVSRRSRRLAIAATTAVAIVLLALQVWLIVDVATDHGPALAAAPPTVPDAPGSTDARPARDTVATVTMHGDGPIVDVAALRAGLGFTVPAGTEREGLFDGTIQPTSFNADNDAPPIPAFATPSSVRVSVGFGACP